MSHLVDSLSLTNKEKISNLFISCFRTRNNQDRFNKTLLHDFEDKNIDLRFRSFVLGYFWNKKVEDITDKYFISKTKLQLNLLFLALHIDSPLHKKHKLSFDVFPNGTFKDVRVKFLYNSFSTGFKLKFY